jgi:hypothetical protein
MKSTIYLFTAVLGLAAVQQASADATIRLTGSTAFRAGTHKGIVGMMGGAANCKFAMAGLTATVPAATQSGYEGADHTVIQGPVAGIGTLTVQCTWTGSATGIKDVAEGNNLNFIPVSSLPVTNGYAAATVGTGAAIATQSTTAKFAFSDVFQASTPTATPELDDNQLAIIPFSWVANEGTTGFTNMTQQLARALYSNGTQPKKLFTGNPSALDANQQVLAIGRDNGSGTRITQLAETQYGVFNPVQQWKLVGTSSITSAQIWPIESSVGAFAPGNGGYSSGSTIRTFMGLTSSSVNLIDADGITYETGIPVTLVAWLGITDSTTAVTNGAVRLSYEGVMYDGTNANLIYEGLYTGWGYLHMYAPSGLTTEEGIFRDNLATQLQDTNVLGTAGLPINLMNVSRGNDGATVGP